MEDMSECLLLNTVPGRNPLHNCASWEKLAWPSKKPLLSWFSNLILRRNQLADWNSSLDLPSSVYLPGLINPMTLLTAIKQVMDNENNIYKY